MIDNASGENLGVVSTCSPKILSVSDCKALFLSFAVYFPRNDIIASNITTLIRNICLVRCASSGPAPLDHVRIAGRNETSGLNAAYLRLISCSPL